MVVLFCAVVGEERIITVEIGNQQLVGVLKELIKKRAGYNFPSDKLALYLAKQNSVSNGAWVTTAHPDYARLSRGDAGVEATYLTTGTLLDPTWSMKDYFAGAPTEKVIHVLVKLPDDRSTAINVPVERSPLLGREVARTTKDGGACVERSSNASFFGSSSWWPFSYPSQLLSKTVSESKKSCSHHERCRDLGVACG
ncbi:hypothetical protein PF011_g21464 [Phytophthora fragariae]|uniref:Crinkler effector protein N-terminal domain-containing protein n=1 Tax=Phytophthora fragariae TaxID=53985 RepID=A0A6A3IIH1_9STRA|nr:hypothetical protein PF011_g21464 [Phytophthora fragariae]